MIIDDAMLDALCLEAAASARRRKNLNFHAAEASRSHRLLNAVEPDSYIRPHRHLDQEKDESIIVVRGGLGVLFFSESGEITMKAELSREKGVYGIDIPHGTLHTVLSLESGTVFFESKAGPYIPITDAERVSWAPGEGEPGASAYLESLRALFRP